VAALKTLDSAAAFQTFFAPILAELQRGKSLRDAQVPWLDGLSGLELYGKWHENADKVANAYASADPRQRVAWAGPEMSALSSITARQMETWAHGQEVFDVLGKRRNEQDRVKNIVHLGVATYGWTFRNRDEDSPDPAPFVSLTAPSGAVWTWNEPQKENAVIGDAVDFARVVTQVRSVGDTALKTIGDTAARWMKIAQCFAGPPEQPPAMGQRRRLT